jgi:hypothetical protein
VRRSTAAGIFAAAERCAARSHNAGTLGSDRDLRTKSISCESAE